MHVGRAAGRASIATIALAIILDARSAHADSDESTVPLRVETDGDPIRVDDELCRGTCEMRVARGRHHVAREVLKDGAWVPDFEADVELVEPTLLRIEGPGNLRKIALVTLVTGGTIVVGGGIVLPILACRSVTTTDPVTGQPRRSYPCDDLSDGVKIGWIAGIGVGLTLVMLGLVGYALTPGTSRVTARTWALHPLVTPERAGSATFGLGFRATF